MSDDSEGFRLRKAWRVRVEEYPSQTYFAPTAGKARVQALTDLSDCSRTYRLIDIHVVRARHFDVKLPERHPLADDLSAEETHCLLHAYGANDDPVKAGYRSYFFTSRNDPTLCSLTERGLMLPNKIAPTEDDTYFHITMLGVLVASSLVPEYRP